MTKTKYLMNIELEKWKSRNVMYQHPSPFLHPKVDLVWPHKTQCAIDHQLEKATMTDATIMDPNNIKMIQEWFG